MRSCSGRVTLQFGGRFDRTHFTPEGGLPERNFNEFSGSVGLLLRPAEAKDDFVIALNLARAARNPALEELYYFGRHPGNFAFEIGNPDLRSERALGFDFSLRARSSRLRAEATFFYNRINDFIFRNPIGQEELEEREEEFDERFHVVDEPGGREHSDELPFVEFVGADSSLFGIEVHADAELTPELFAELTSDWVRGELRASGEPLPRIPPFRLIAGLRYQKNAFQVGGAVTAIGDQNRVFGAETPTAGAGLLRVFENAGNTRYFNHHYLKDVLPEMVRNFKLVYTVSF